MTSAASGPPPGPAGHRDLQDCERALVAAAARYGREPGEEVVRACIAVLESLDALDALGPAANGDADADSLRVRTLRVLLSASELWWRSGDGNGDGNGTIGIEPWPAVPLHTLVTQAEEAAARTADRALRASARHMAGQHLVVTHSLDAALTALTKAVELARAAGDTFTELEALTDLGHCTVGRDMKLGVGMLERAETLASRSPGAFLHPEQAELLPMTLARLTGHIGVAAFDRGTFDTAESRLRDSLHRLSPGNTPGPYAKMTNFLGQLLTAAGRFEEAEVLLTEAVGRIAPRATASTHQGYNLGLLGKLYLEWDRPDQAAPPLLAGWEHLRAAPHVSLLPLLRNYLGELLMHPSYARRDVTRACDLFTETVEECRRTGFQRSEIAALMLGARGALQLGDPQSALALSDRAVERLAETGEMPALRSEEVYFTRYEILLSAGRQEHATPWLDRARAVLLAKGRTIADPAARNAFYTRVPTSRSILAASE
ncbi:hypothetical protein Q3V23_02030 [Streptomyces sp. VNUA116]|uniref:hypothetical protein n=1 Tax=Streptomyces sp. VNUA116 TaxID=3062449 RepID=UPI002675E998|nr:hypothetical protein [Streptomyces sp. VNUA116]WKU42943.1 hypothetical protein Q3V23_02030 [Streptomyces sp. VNUA116]